MKFQIIILVFLNCFFAKIIGQDLEQVVPAKPATSTDKVVDNSDEIAPLTSEKHIKSELPDSIEIIKELTSTRDREPDTYRKQEYLNKLLRQTYYHRLTTPVWAKYFNPESWGKNMLKWRYWDQLKNYVTGNNEEIIVLRNSVLKTKNLDSNTVSSNLLDSSLTDRIIAISETKDSTINKTNQDVQFSEPNLIEYHAPAIVSSEEENPNEQEKIPVVTATHNKPKEQVTARPIVKEPLTQNQKTDQVGNNAKTYTSTETITKAKKTEVTGNARVITNTNEPFVKRKGSVQWPVDGGRVTDGFGLRANAEARGLRPQNYGIDMLCPAGSIVKTVHAGTVLMSKRQSPYDFIVTVKHGDFTTAYYYLINTYVKPGDEVQIGQALGQLRTSVSEADFHFEIWNNQDRVNPERWLKRR